VRASASPVGRERLSTVPKHPPLARGGVQKKKALANKDPCDLFFQLSRGLETMIMDGNALRHDSSLGWRHGLDERSDEQLMLAFQKGDSQAFEMLLRRHEKGVFRFALRMLGDGMLAEEVTQESFLRIIQSASRYRAKASFRNYLYRVARNLCVDLLRRRPREPRTPDVDPGSPGTPEGLVDPNPGPENQVGAAQLRSVLRRALSSLPPDQREAFLLKEVKGMRLQDVAAITGANLNTVKSRLRYALMRLREHLEEQGVGKEIRP
jgi:RNA polymerase sigma-70 factor (ECF subfamily)